MDPRINQFPHVVIVEASAGSGKTYALANRYIQLLLDSKLTEGAPVSLETILAITFTNKAAIEMKERILEFLKKIALGKFQGYEENPASEKAHLVMDSLVRNYNYFQVQTIDSFINAILSGCAFKLGLSAGFKTQKDYHDYLSFSLDKLIDQANSEEAIKKLFHEFITQYLHLENKSAWFPKKDILVLVTTLFTKSNKNAGQFARNEMDAAELVSCRKEILRLMRELHNNLPSGAYVGLVDNLSAVLGGNKESFDIEKLSDYFKRELFPAKKGCFVSDETQGLWEKIREHLSQLCEIESALMLNCYVDIFNYVLRNLEDVSKKADILFLESLNKEAAKLFDEGSLDLPELYYRLAARFRHFLIDEFQDTSALQWSNLYSMIMEALSTGGSFFYVGDRKQAIYRFRGGEVSLINSVKDAFGQYNLIECSLTNNYRSQKEIVEFNNKVFSRENLLRLLDQKETDKRGVELSSDDVNAVVDIFKGSQQAFCIDKDEGSVKVEFIDHKIKDERDRAVKEKLLLLLSDLTKRFSFGDIAILCRKNNDTQLVTGWLLENGIPAESETTLDIRENAYIKELVSFLKFLSSPIDNLSFASFILGEIFSKATGMGSCEIRDFLFRFNNRLFRSSEKDCHGLLRRPRNDTEAGLRHNPNDGVLSGNYLYRQFRQEFPEVWDNFIDEFFKSAGFIPLYELLISILSKFNVVKDFPNCQGFFMRLLELIKEQEEEHFNISSFLEFFEDASPGELYVNVTACEAVRLLTIHKSKGLEFRVVIIPFLEMDVKIEPEVVMPEESSGLLRLAYIKKSYAKYSSAIAEIRKEEYLKSFIDELNNVYVALTRAEDELYVFVSPRAGTNFNLASILLGGVDFVRNDKIGITTQPSRVVPASEKHKKNLALKISPSEYRNWIDFLKEEFIDQSMLKERTKILNGEVLHYILSFIGNLYQLDSASLIKNALEKARLEFPLIFDFDEFELTVNKLLQKKELKRFFEVGQALVFLEKEIVSSSGNTKRIDRLVVSSKEVWVIDYKSAPDEAANYKEQVREYMEIMKEIYPEKKIRGFLIYLDDLSSEEIGGLDKS